MFFNYLQKALNTTKNPKKIHKNLKENFFLTKNSRLLANIGTVSILWIFKSFFFLEFPDLGNLKNYKKLTKK
jgi:hypothetical protein